MPPTLKGRAWLIGVTLGCVHQKENFKGIFNEYQYTNFLFSFRIAKGGLLVEQSVQIEEPAKHPPSKPPWCRISSLGAVPRPLCICSEDADGNHNIKLQYALFIFCFYFTFCDFSFQGVGRIYSCNLVALNWSLKSKGGTLGEGWCKKAGLG